jgi:LacI family transcriptional regulator
MTIAEAANVSRSTVSLALRNSPQISIKTRNRVQEVAKLLNYRPNPLLSAYQSHIRKGNTGKSRQATLAWVEARSKGLNTEQEARHDRCNSEMFEAAKKRAEEQGYDLESFDLTEYESRTQRLNGILRARSTAGIIIPVFTGDMIKSLDFDWESYVSICIHYGLEEPRLCHVAPDYNVSMHRLLNELNEYGYRRIGMVLHRMINTGSRDIISARFNEHLQTQPLNQRVPLLMIDSDESDEAAIDAWYEEYQPDAIACSFGSLSFDIFEWVERRGLRVPEDLGLATFSRAEIMTENQRFRSISGFYECIQNLGATAADVVIDQLNRNEIGIPNICRNTLIEGFWHNGSTLRKMAVRRTSKSDSPRILQEA